MKVAHAQKLLEKYVSGETLLRHCRTVAAVLRHFAEKRGERDAEFWESVGLLHDIDFEQYPEQHCVKARDIFEAEKPNFPAADGGSEITEELVHAVLSHGWQICCDVEPVHPMERILYTVDELTGLIFACAMARPSKSVMDMEVKSVTKKFKSAGFAAGCSREVILRGAGLMGVPLNDVIFECIEAMRARHESLGV